MKRPCLAGGFSDLLSLAQRLCCLLAPLVLAALLLDTNSYSGADLDIWRLALITTSMPLDWVVPKWLCQHSDDIEFCDLAENGQADDHAIFTGLRVGAIGAKQAVPPR